MNQITDEAKTSRKHTKKRADKANKINAKLLLYSNLKNKLDKILHIQDFTFDDYLQLGVTRNRYVQKINGKLELHRDVIQSELDIICDMIDKLEKMKI